MPTVTIYASTSDNEIRSEDAVRANAANGTGTLALQTVTNTSIEVGSFGSFTYQEGFFAFDATGVIPVGAIISSAVFSFTKAFTGTDPGTVEIRLYDWGAAVDTGDFRSKANLDAATLLADGNPNATAVDAEFSFTNVAAPANIVANGVTRVVMATANQRTGTASDGQFKMYAADETGTTKDPKLVVTYTVGSASLLMAGD